MKVSEVLKRIREYLQDHNDYEYQLIDAGNLVEFIRGQIHDTAGNQSISDILSLLRQNLSDSPLSSCLTENGILQSVRTKLGDVPDSDLGETTGSSVDVSSVIHYAAWGNLGGVIGTDGTINESVSYAAGNGSLSDYISDGLKTIKGMRPDCVLNGILGGGFQAALNLYVLARCIEGEVEVQGDKSRYSMFYDRFVAAVGQVAPHVPDNVLLHYLNQGKQEIENLRPDLGICGATGGLLEDYVMFHASQTKNGTATNLQVNLSTFYQNLQNIPYHWSDEELQRCLEMGRIEIESRRPDLSGSSRYDTLLLDFATSQAFAIRIGKENGAAEKCKFYLDKFHDGLENTPRHYNDAELHQIIDEGLHVLKSYRNDAFNENGEFRIDFMPSLVSYINTVRFYRESVNVNLQGAWKQRFDEYLYHVQMIPYHWTDNILLRLLHDSLADILLKRSDARQDENGYEIHFSIEPGVNDNYPLRDSLRKCSEHYCVYHALTIRFGKSTGGGDQFQFHYNEYQKGIGK